MHIRHAALGLTPNAILGRLAAIGAIVLGAALVFAYAGGWLSPHRLTPDRTSRRQVSWRQPARSSAQSEKHLLDRYERRWRAAVDGTNLCSRKLSAHRPVRHRNWQSQCSRCLGPCPQHGHTCRHAGRPEWQRGMNNRPMFVVATPAGLLSNDIDPGC
jgi:catalase